ncbi:esterase/lipase family protein [Corynebacterium sp. 335C]
MPAKTRRLTAASAAALAALMAMAPVAGAQPGGDGSAPPSAGSAAGSTDVPGSAGGAFGSSGGRFDDSTGHVTEGPVFPELDWANDDSCVPSPEHPRPVLLVHGTWSTAEEMGNLGRALKERGHCVWAATHGAGDASLAGIFGSDGLAPMAEGARQVHEAIEHVAERTDAGRAAGEIDIVGHSLGGALIRLALHDHGDYVRAGTVVTLAGTNHGTDMLKAAELGVNGNPVTREVGRRTLGAAPMDQITDSPAAKHLNSLPDTMPGVDYVVMVTVDDTTSYPPLASFLEAGPGATVRNVVVEDVCADLPRPFDHVDMRDAPVMGGLVADALAGRAPACRA